MKQFLPVVWWLTATLVIAFVLVGLGYLFADALLLGVLFLPGMLTARYFVPQLSFENRRQGILDTVYLALAILGIEYLSLMLGHAYRTKTRISQWETQLDSRFLRIHRSFIVNTARIDRCCPAHVEIGGMTIEISRKYREAARRQLTEQAANA